MKTKNITDNFSKFSKKKLLNPVNDRGMTLIELLVVLGILAALAGMTLSFVSEMNSSARQTVTRTKLDQIETAIAGDGTQTSRFLNDMGRLPVAVTENVLSELWDSELFNTDTNNPTIEYTGYENDITDTNKLKKTQGITVSINGGWKGPYLNVTNKKLYDGFGNDFHVVTPEEAKTANPNNLENDPLNFIEDEKMFELNPNGTILKFGSFGEDDQFNDSNSNWQNTNVIKEFRRSQVFSTLHVNILLRDSSTSPATWLPPKFIENPVQYKLSESGSYKAGTVVEAEIDNKDYLFACISSPLSVSTNSDEPDWNLSEVVMDDQEREWAWLPRTTCLNRLRVTVFSPYVETPSTGLKRTAVRTATAFYPFDEPSAWGQDFSVYNPDTATPPVWEKSPDADDCPVEIQGNKMGKINGTKRGDTMNEVTFYNLTPGIRKIFAYGYVENGNSTTYSNARHSHVQTIELKSGENFITIYLNEAFFD